MVVDIDINKLLNFGISVEEYFILMVIHKKGFTSLKRYYARNPAPTEEVLQSLVEKGLIHNGNKPGEFNAEKIIVRYKFIKEKKSEFDSFDELYTLYPAKVTRPDGSVDYLRTDKTRCQKLYLAYIKRDSSIHDNVMESLRFEITQRNNDGSISYMKRLPKWLASEEWLVWNERLRESTKAMEHFGYGLKLE